MHLPSARRAQETRPWKSDPPQPPREPRVSDRRFPIDQGELRSILSNLSHELCRPLASLRAGFDLLLGESSSTITPDQRSHLLTMVSLCDDLLRLTRSYLDYAGIVQGSRPLCLGSFTIGALIARDRPPVRARSPRPATLDWEARADSPETAVVTDASRCQQIFGNLVSNALKYTPDGRPGARHREGRRRFVVGDRLRLGAGHSRRRPRHGLRALLPAVPRRALGRSTGTGWAWRSAASSSLSFRARSRCRRSRNTGHPSPSFSHGIRAVSHGIRTVLMVEHNQSLPDIPRATWLAEADSLDSEAVSKQGQLPRRLGTSPSLKRLLSESEWENPGAPPRQGAIGVNRSGMSGGRGSRQTGPATDASWSRGLYAILRPILLPPGWRAVRRRGSKSERMAASGARTTSGWRASSEHAGLSSSRDESSPSPPVHHQS